MNSFEGNQQQNKQNQTEVTTTTTTHGNYQEGNKDQNGSSTQGTQGPQSHAGLPTVNGTIPMTSDGQTAESMTNDSANKL